MSDQLFGRVELSCKATVGGQTVEARELVAAPVYDDPEARSAVEAYLRYKLMMAALERWTPKIYVRR